MESIGWQWDETDHPEVYADFGDGRFVFTHNDDHRTAEIRRIKDSSSWVQTIPDTTADSAVLVVHDERLYVALYSRGLTGVVGFLHWILDQANDSGIPPLQV